MFTSQHRLARPTTGIAALTLLTLCIVAGPAAARQDSGPNAPRIDHEAHRSLARVGIQYVVGDDLTGNGVPAPAWISSPVSTTHPGSGGPPISAARSISTAPRPQLHGSAAGTPG